MKDINSKKIIQNILKNVHSKKNWKCTIDGCSENAINSHLLQNNGILNVISEDSHLYEIKPVGPFNWGKDTPAAEIKRVSARNAISLPLLCNNHDSEIFKEIEIAPIDFCSYDTFLLFSYRTILSEYRKKEMNIELFTRILNASSLNDLKTCVTIVKRLSRKLKIRIIPSNLELINTHY